MGLVGSPSSFGKQGDRPSHPRLLDYLALRFIEEGWSIKAMHRRIMLSSVYRMSSDDDATSRIIDPENRFLWRMNRRRLEAEPLRDAMLTMGDNLDLKMGGRVEAYNPQGYVFNEGDTFIGSDFYGAPRRSVYMPIVRNAMYKMFAAFDYGDSAMPIGRRPSTVIASQALFVMNSPLMVTQAELFAQSLLGQEHQGDAARIKAGFIKAYGREPTILERAEAIAFLDRMKSLSQEDADEDESAELFAWKNICHVIMAASEFMYIN